MGRCKALLPVMLEYSYKLCEQKSFMISEAFAWQLVVVCLTGSKKCKKGKVFNTFLDTGKECSGGVWYIFKHMSASGESNNTNRGTYIIVCSFAFVFRKVILALHFYVFINIKVECHIHDIFIDGKLCVSNCLICIFMDRKRF